MRLLAYMKYGDLAASTRQRLAQYEPYLNAHGIDVDYRPLLGNAHLRRFAAGRRASPAHVIAAYAQRLWHLLRRSDHDVVWVHYELFPYLPGWLEGLSRAGGRPIVYDYDDAIFHMYDESPSRLVRSLLSGKLVPLLRGADACLCGNAYLRAYASRHCGNSIVLPTVVDTDIWRPRPGPSATESAPVIGWMGSPSTWRYVRPLLPLLADVARNTGARLRMVGAGPAAEANRFTGLELAEWSRESEVAEVQAMDIGIMPLPDEPWTRGKCGYKLIQYMACGLPVVASPVGVNSEIVTPGVDGFLAGDENAWREALTTLVGDAVLRRRLGEAGRARMVADYSLATHAPRLVALLKSLEAPDQDCAPVSASQA